MVLRNTGYYVNARTDFQEDVRALAGASLPGRFSLHRVVATRLGAANARVLVLQNIKDGQGDEIVRCVPLLQSLLDYNRELEIVLVTQRAYMYAHPRVTIIPPGEHDRFDAVLQQSFDGVVDFFEWNVRELNHSPHLEPLVQSYITERRPFLVVTSSKGYDHCVYERVEVDGRAFAASLGLDKQRV